MKGWLVGSVQLLRIALGTWFPTMFCSTAFGSWLVQLSPVFCLCITFWRACAKRFYVLRFCASATFYRETTHMFAQHTTFRTTKFDILKCATPFCFGRRRVFFVAERSPPRRWTMCSSINSGLFCRCRRETFLGRFRLRHFFFWSLLLRLTPQATFFQAYVPFSSRFYGGSAARYVCRCVLHIEPFFLLVDIQRTQCPCRLFLLERYKLCGDKLVPYKRCR